MAVLDLDRNRHTDFTAMISIISTHTVYMRWTGKKRGLSVAPATRTQGGMDGGNANLMLPAQLLVLVAEVYFAASEMMRIPRDSRRKNFWLPYINKRQLYHSIYEISTMIFILNSELWNWWNNNNNWNSSFNNNKLSQPIGGERSIIASGKPYVS